MSAESPSSECMTLILSYFCSLDVFAPDMTLNALTVFPRSDKSTRKKKQHLQNLFLSLQASPQSREHILVYLQGVVTLNTWREGLFSVAVNDSPFPLGTNGLIICFFLRGIILHFLQRKKFVFMLIMRIIIYVLELSFCLPVTQPLQ